MTQRNFRRATMKEKANAGRGFNPPLQGNQVPEGTPNARYWAYVLTCLNKKINPVSLEIWQAALNPQSRSFDQKIASLTPPRRAQPGTSG